ncbi:tyrosine-protein phosphatase [Empedobacter brevis]|uniref:tyrosine-protein phosphatase n=1 Tax=Empedobacter brevis TaxID=247 RepID=UPI0028D858A4|nr:tyrosine-protein phosphatase [Empedobacter brevis]
MKIKCITALFLVFLNSFLFSCSSYKIENVEFSEFSTSRETHIKKVNNLRALGKLTNRDGRFLKDSLLYRSADLHKLKDTDKIKQFDIQNIIDLRTDDEISKKPDVVIPHVNYNHYPAFTDKEDQLNQARKLVLKGKVNATDAYNRMIKFYQEYPIENPEMIKTIITKILDADNPILYHCTAGKDRTGMISAFILKILNFDDETIYQDYLLSNNLRKHIIQKRLNKAKHLHFLFPKADLKVLEKLSWIEYDYLKAAFDEIDAKYGSFDLYIKTVLNISDEKRNDYINKFTYIKKSESLH